MSRDRPSGRLTLSRRRKNDMGYGLWAMGSGLWALGNRASRVAQDASDALGKAGPALALELELLLALGRDLVEPSFPVLLCGAPAAPQPSVLFHPMQCRVE